MPEVPVGYGQAQADISLTGDTELMTVGMGFKITSTATFTQAMADFFSGEFLSAINATTASEYETIQTNFVVGLTGGDVEASSGDGAGVGTNTGDPVPQNSAYLIRKRSGLVGRKNRGRMYIPGVIESGVNELGQLTTGVANALQSTWGDFRTNIEADANFDGLSILHSLGDSTIPTPVTALIVDTVIATQRRRLR